MKAQNIMSYLGGIFTSVFYFSSIFVQYLTTQLYNTFLFNRNSKINYRSNYEWEEFNVKLQNEKEKENET